MQQTRSHLYKSDGALVGTYQRIDIPILPHFDQYIYVLFTGDLACEHHGDSSCKLHSFTQLSSAAFASAVHVVQTVMCISANG
jgi:hypothetical protein